MSNKYSKWNLASSYTDLKKVDKNLLLQNPYLDVNINIDEEIIKQPVLKYNIRQLLGDIINIEIIARIAASGALTGIQITCFLNLQGYNIKLDEVNERIARMQKECIIQVFCSYDKEHTKYIEYVVLCYWGLMIGSILGAVSLNETTFICEEAKNIRNKKAHFLMAINDIILDQLLNNEKNIVSFNINYRQKIPLLLRTRTNTYAFICCTHYWLQNVEKITSLMNKLDGTENSKVIPVLIVLNETLAIGIINQLKKIEYEKKVFFTVSVPKPLAESRKIQCIETVGNSNITLNIAAL